MRKGTLVGIAVVLVGVGVGGYVLMHRKTPAGATQAFVETAGKLPGDAGDRLDIQVTGLRNSKGTVRCALYDRADGFPEDLQKVAAHAVALPANASAVCHFTGLEKSHTYAVALSHDENNDNVFQKNALGLPEEGYGFSNNFKPLFSVPTWDDCKFAFTSGAMSVQVTAIY